MTGTDLTGVTWDTSNDAVFSITQTGPTTAVLKLNASSQLRSANYLATVSDLSGTVTATAADGASSSVSFDQKVIDHIAISPSTHNAPNLDDPNGIAVADIAISSDDPNPTFSTGDGADYAVVRNDADSATLYLGPGADVFGQAYVNVSATTADGTTATPATFQESLGALASNAFMTEVGIVEANIANSTGNDTSGVAQQIETIDIPGIAQSLSEAAVAGSGGSFAQDWTGNSQGVAIFGQAGVGTILGGDGGNLIHGGESVLTGNGNNVAIETGSGATFTLGTGNNDIVNSVGDGSVVLPDPEAFYSIAIANGVVTVQDNWSGATDVLQGVSRFSFSDQQNLSQADLADDTPPTVSETPVNNSVVDANISVPTPVATLTLQGGDPASRTIGFWDGVDGSLSLKSPDGEFELVHIQDGTWTVEVEPGQSLSVDQTLSDPVFAYDNNVGTVFGTEVSAQVVQPLSIQITPNGASLTQASRADGGIELATLSAAGYLSDTATFQVDPNSIFSIEDGDQLWLKPQHGSLAQLGITDLTVPVTATTSAGSATATFSEPVPPDVSISGPTGYVSSASELIFGTVIDANPGVVVSIYDNNGLTPVATANVLSDGEWQATVSLLQGENSLVAKATDLADDAGASAPDVLYLGSMGWAGGSTPSIDEFPTAGTAVGAVAPNFGNGSAVWTFSLSDPCNGAFAIDPATGGVTVANGSGLNYDAEQSVSVTAFATDQKGNSVSAPLTVDLTPQHAPPTAFSYTTTAALSQFTASGTKAVTLTGVADVDQTDGFRLVLAGDPTGGDFGVSIDGQSIVVNTANALPVGTTNLTLNVVDGDGFTMASPLTVPVTVAASTKQIQDAQVASAIMRFGGVAPTSNLTTLKGEFGVASFYITITALPGGADKMTFSPGTVTISSGDDLFQTNAQGGNLAGTSGVDYMVGEAGAKTTFLGSASTDFVVGSGSDTVNYSSSTSGVTVNLAQKISGTNADKAQTGGDASGDVYVGIENVTGSQATNSANSFTGDSAANVFTGGPGSNTFVYSPGGDTYVGKAGATNTVNASASSANATINLATGTMTVGADAPTTLVNINSVTGTTGTDTVTLGASTSSVSANASNDIFYGGLWSAYITAIGAGDYFNMGSGAESITAGTTATFDFSHSAGITLTPNGISGYNGSAGAQGDSLTVTNAGYNFNSLNWKIMGSNGADNITISGSGNYTYAGGAGGVDAFNAAGKSGNHTVTIASGSAYGGAGADNFTATTGGADFDPGVDLSPDVMTFLGSGTNTLDFSHDNGCCVYLDFPDGVYKGSNTNPNGIYNLATLNDTYYGENYVIGTGGDDTIYAAPGMTVDGYAGADVIHASNSGNTIMAEGSADLYVGEPTLYGGNGNDTLIGGYYGGTTLDGGGGTNILDSRAQSGTGDTFEFAPNGFIKDEIQGWHYYDHLSFAGGSAACVLDPSTDVCQSGANVMINSTLGQVQIDNASVGSFMSNGKLLF